MQAEADAFVTHDSDFSRLISRHVIS